MIGGVEDKRCGIRESIELLYALNKCILQTHVIHGIKISLEIDTPQTADSAIILDSQISIELCTRRLVTSCEDWTRQAIDQSTCN